MELPECLDVAPVLVFLDSGFVFRSSAALALQCMPPLAQERQFCAQVPVLPTQEASSTTWDVLTMSEN